MIVEKTWSLIKNLMHFVFFRILHLDMSEDTWLKWVQFAKFGLVGVSNTVISYSIYVICLLLFEKNRLFVNLDYLIAQGIAFFLSVLWSFYWNRKYVFHADGENVPWPQALLKTYLSYAFTGLFLNSILSIIWVQVLHIPKIVAPIANLLIAVPINFLLNKYWAFKEKA